MKWFSIDWWAYIFEVPFDLRMTLCRIKGHPNGVVWYDITRIEPDMHCVDCDEDLS